MWVLYRGKADEVYTVPCNVYVYCTVVYYCFTLVIHWEVTNIPHQWSIKDESYRLYMGTKILSPVACERVK